MWKNRNVFCYDIYRFSYKFRNIPNENQLWVQVDCYIETSFVCTRRPNENWYWISTLKLISSIVKISFSSGLGPSQNRPPICNINSTNQLCIRVEAFQESIYRQPYGLTAGESDCAIMYTHEAATFRHNQSQGDTMQSATLINRLPEAELRAVGVWHAIDMGPDHVTLRVHHYGREYWVSATDTVRYGSWDRKSVV